jgi:hypothetical protein
MLKIIPCIVLINNQKIINKSNNLSIKHIYSYFLHNLLLNPTYYELICLIDCVPLSIIHLVN